MRRLLLAVSALLVPALALAQSLTLPPIAAQVATKAPIDNPTLTGTVTLPILAATGSGNVIRLSTGQVIRLDTAGNVGVWSDGTRIKMGRGFTIQDSSTPVYGVGFAAQVDNRLAQFGINDTSIDGTQDNTAPGGFIRFETRGGPLFQIYARAAGAANVGQILSIDAAGNMVATGIVRGTAFNASGTAGVTCTGAPTTNFRTVGGIVTAC
ncbi:hypothetical protein [Methylobacterium sp. J-068]|uniref:hypothetical protein n=1 Tax=Methylobacterium sp. J-068 TaxID=2836649 RepID=UPI001FBA479A|nr:hypothetical protein [Methylobacterium sp. J-068]MCJ2034246.1 hypothetical protein [Methylobacterium sp. J-068]